MAVQSIVNTSLKVTPPLFHPTLSTCVLPARRLEHHIKVLGMKKALDQLTWPRYHQLLSVCLFVEPVFLTDINGAALTRLES